jgi:VCBS repeat-containing protein
MFAVWAHQREVTMGYRGRGYWNYRNQDKVVDVSDSNYGTYVRTWRGDDQITGSDHGDWIRSGAGDDTVEGGGGNDVMFGGRGQDTAIFSGSILDYKIYSCFGGRWTFVSGDDGCDFLHRFEILQFDDFTYNLRENNDPLAVLRDEDLSAGQDDTLAFHVDLYDLDGGAISVDAVTVTGGGSVSFQSSGVQDAALMGTSQGLEIAFDPGNAYDYLAEGETTTETVTVTVSDGQGGTRVMSYDITIEGANDAPVATAVSVVTQEDERAELITAEFTDVDSSDVHSFSIDTSGTLGVVTNNGDGTFGYDTNGQFEHLAVGETATDSFTFTVDDGNGGMSTETVTITISGENDGPVANAINTSAGEDGPAVVITADFSDADSSDAHSFSVDTTGTVGSVTNNGDGTFGYDPNGQFEHLAVGETATDTFSYTVDDGNGGTATETVTVTITGANDAPVIAASSSTAGIARAAIDFGDNLDAGELLTVFDGAAGSASLATVGGQEALRVSAQGVTRIPHTEIDLISAGQLQDDDVVVVNITSFNTRTGGDQDVLIGLTDGVNHLSIFAADGGGLGFFADSVFASGEYGVGFPETPPTNDRTTFSLGQNLDNFSVRLQIDAANDQITLLAGGPGATNIIGSAPLSGDAGEWLDPSLGLKLTVSNDGRNETFYYNSLEYDVSVASRDASGQIVFDDVDVSDTHSASVTNVALSGEVGALQAADVTNLLNLTTTSTVADSGGTIDWSFASAGTTFDYLAAGESLEIAYTVTVDDGSGGSADQVVTITVEGTNQDPVAGEVSASITEAPQTVMSAGIGSFVAPNLGRWYVFDFDTGIASSVQRDGGANKFAQQIADQYLSDGNGIMVQPNPNNSGWGFAGTLFIDGVESAIPSSDLIVTDTDGGAISLSNPHYVTFADANKNVDSIKIELDNLDLGGGRTIDVRVTAGPFDYEVGGVTDNLYIDGVQFQAAENPAPAEVIVTADVSDVDGDTFVFEIDDTSTWGNVVDNGDGTFTYSTGDAFEHLADGETATDSFTYTVFDEAGGQDSNVVTLMIYGSDDLIFA